MCVVDLGSAKEQSSCGEKGGGVPLELSVSLSSVSPKRRSPVLHVHM